MKEVRLDLKSAEASTVRLLEDMIMVSKSESPNSSSICAKSISFYGNSRDDSNLVSLEHYSEHENRRCCI